MPCSKVAAITKRSIAVQMTAREVIDQIKALPPEEKTKVEVFVQLEIEERWLAEEKPAVRAAIDEGARSPDDKGGREYTLAELEQKIRRCARGGSH